MNDAQAQADGKWVDGLTPETSATKAARRVLTVRFAAVRESTPPAPNWGPDSEPVHRLRVATRRARAALDAFSDLLPRKTVRKTRRQLKRLRTAAANAREADVFMDGVRTWAVHQSPADRPGLYFLIGHAFARRCTAQAKLVATVEKASTSAIRAFDNLPRKVHDDKKETLGERAMPTLTGLLHDLDAAAAGNLDDYQQLHGVRIVIKRLRYALELFIDCCPSAVREQLYPRVETAQDVLGLANDSHQAIVLLDELIDGVRVTQPGLWDVIRGGMEGLRAHHHQRVKEQRTAFADWWRSWQLLQPDAMLSGVTTPAKPAAADLPLRVPAVP
jgi:CHAD domain-containing protein